MNKDNQEIEIKIKLDNKQALIDKIIGLDGKKTYESLEQDIYYDDGKGLYGSGRVLRIRKEKAGTLLTYKDPLEKHENLLKRVELQTRVEDGEALEHILEKLGYIPKYKKERNVVYYELQGLKFEFHTLPFMGEFLEVEAGEQTLSEILPKLDLSLAQGVPKGYHTLFEEYKKAHNLPEDLQLTFDEEKR